MLGFRTDWRHLISNPQVLRTTWLDFVWKVSYQIRMINNTDGSFNDGCKQPNFGCNSII